MLRKLLYALFLSVTLAFTSVSVQEVAKTATQTPGQSTFAGLVERVKKGDTSVNFAELRMAYTETKEYDPYGPDRDAQSKMFAALNGKDFAKTLEVAEKILKDDFVEINAHYCSYIAHRELGRADKAAFHKAIVDGLLKSITSSGDGKTEGSAFVVISTNEEYTLFRFWGLRPSGQSLLNNNGHSFDKMTVVDPKTNETLTYFFNIDKVFGWWNRTLKK